MSLLLDRDLKKNIIDEGFVTKAVVTAELELRKVRQPVIQQWPQKPTTILCGIYSLHLPHHL